MIIQLFHCPCTCMYLIHMTQAMFVDITAMVKINIQYVAVIMRQDEQQPSIIINKVVLCREGI